MNSAAGGATCPACPLASRRPAGMLAGQPDAVWPAVVKHEAAAPKILQHFNNAVLHHCCVVATHSIRLQAELPRSETLSTFGPSKSRRALSLKIYQPQWAILLGLLWLKLQQQQHYPSHATPQYTKNSSAAAKRPRSCPQQTLITQYTVHLCTLGAFPCQH